MYPKVGEQWLSGTLCQPCNHAGFALVASVFAGASTYHTAREILRETWSQTEVGANGSARMGRPQSVEHRRTQHHGVNALQGFEDELLVQAKDM